MIDFSEHGKLPESPESVVSLVGEAFVTSWIVMLTKDIIILNMVKSIFLWFSTTVRALCIQTYTFGLPVVECLKKAISLLFNVLHSNEPVYLYL